MRMYVNRTKAHALQQNTDGTCKWGHSHFRCHTMHGGAYNERPDKSNKSFLFGLGHTIAITIITNA